MEGWKGGKERQRRTGLTQVCLLPFHPSTLLPFYRLVLAVRIGLFAAVVEVTVMSPRALTV